MQAQPHIMPGSQHEPQLRRGPHHQQLQLPQRLGGAQFVHVIDDQPDPLPQRRQVRQQALHDRLPVQVRRRRHGMHQRRARRCLAERAQHRQPELLRIPFAAPDRHPRGTAGHVGLADPGPQHDRLAAPRRCRHHGHAGRRREPLEQPGTGNDTSRARTSDAAGSGIRSDGGTHGPDHRTTQPTGSVAIRSGT